MLDYYPLPKSYNRYAVWPDVGIKSSPNFYQCSPISSFTSKLMIFRVFQKAPKRTFSDTIVSNFDANNLQKMAQSGHTASMQRLRSGVEIQLQ